MGGWRAGDQAGWRGVSLQLWPRDGAALSASPPLSPLSPLGLSRSHADAAGQTAGFAFLEIFC